MAKDASAKPGTLLENVIIFTKQMELLASFYREALEIGPFEHSPGHMGCQIGEIYFGFDEVNEDEAGFSGKHLGVSLWFTVDDIEATFERLVDMGAELRYPPTPKPWGAILASVYDPDGNILGLTQRHN